MTIDAPIVAPVTNGHNHSHLEALPDDVLAHILSGLQVDDLLRLQSLSKTFQDRISNLGIPRHLTSHPTAYTTVSPPSSSWRSYELLRRNTIVARALRKRLWHALQVSPTWPQPVIPALLLTPDRLILGVGGKLAIHPFVPPSGIGAKAVARGREHPVAKRGSGSGADVVGVVPLNDGQVGVAQYDGTLQRFSLPPENGTGTIRSTAHYPHPEGSNIHTLSGGGKFMMTIMSSGLVSLWKANSPWLPPSTAQLPQGQRAWSSLLASDHLTLTPTALLGLSGGVDIHTIHPTGLSPTPYRQLRGPELPSTSSPYDLIFPPSPSVHHPSLLLSAWYDSHLRLHDLRSPYPYPVQSFSDPYTWADGSAMYSCAFLSETYLCGGGARHGVVSFFDSRMVKPPSSSSSSLSSSSSSGWSCFSPGGKGSPVYSLAGDGGRVWGVTEKRTFVLAFDGSGSVEEGLVLRDARAEREKVTERPNGWKGRGGKWGWTVRYNHDRQDAASTGEGEGAVGYEHGERTVRLFDSLPVV